MDTVNTQSTAQSATVETTTPVAETATTTIATPNDTPAATETTTDWRGLLSDDIKSNKALDSFKDINSLAKSYLHGQSLIGKRIAELSPEELGQVYSKLGRPETAEGYELPAPEGDPIVTSYRQIAHDLGLSKQTAETLYRRYADTIVEQQKVAQEAFEKQAETHREALKQEWGSAYKERLEYARRGALSLGGEELLKEVMNSPTLGNNPMVIKALANAGMKLRESAGFGSSDSAAFTMTPEMANRELASLKADPVFISSYINGRAPGHKEAVIKMNELYVLAGMRPADN